MSWNTKYTQIKTLGDGGQGNVFLVEDHSGNRFALKELSFEAARFQPVLYKRMKREIQGQKSLNHPNIMPIYDHDENFTWFTMPVAEYSLYQLGENNLNKLPDDQLISILEHSILGIAAAHAQNIIHRDIKPGNILYLNTSTQQGWVVSDWGLVRLHGYTTAEYTQLGIGTPGFGPPELEDDPHNVTPACDVYSIGRIAARYVIGRKLQTNIISLPDPTSRWYDFIEQTTKLDPLDRPQEMKDVMELLDGVRNRLIRTPTSTNATKARKETFAPYLKQIIEYLWNDGIPQEVNKSDLSTIIGQSAYGNHNKLSLKPWDLVENSSQRNHRKLTQRGIEFAKGNLSIPQSIIKNDNDEWVGDPFARSVTINDL